MILDRQQLTLDQFEKIYPTASDKSMIEEKKLKDMVDLVEQVHCNSRQQNTNKKHP